MLVVAIFGFFVLVSAFGVLGMIVKKVRARIKNRIWFTALGIQISIFLVVSDQRVLSGVFDN